GKVCVVTGGSSGIGLATAQLLAKQGGAVVLAARGQDRLNKAVDIIKASGGEAFGVIADASKDEDNKQLVDAVLEKYHRLDVSFINAGIYRPATLTEVTEATVDELFATNVKGVAFALKYQLPAIEKSGGHGSIVINSSVAGRVVAEMPEFGGNGPFSASKAGADMLMRHAAIEASRHGTRVNSIAPGIVHTGAANMSQEVWDVLGTTMSLMARAGRPEEIAACVCFLLSDEASFVTGTVMVADGGVSIKG
ncbi:short-chain dehydrogenase/reductase SDR, partial [Tribonema minus]